MTNLDFALSYAARGWAVLPVHTPLADGKCSCGKDGCKNVGKHPRVFEWQKNATTDERTIRKWWSQWPDANIGINPRSSGLVVIDVDPRNGGDDTWHELKTRHGLNDDTVTSLTGGGGLHIIYKINGADYKSLKTSLGPGVDVQRGDKFIVAPPSLHASGNNYEWELSCHPDDTEVLNIPPSLLEILVKEGQDAVESELAELIPQGERNNRLTSLAGTLRRRGLEPSEMLPTLEEVNKRCRPPLEHDELVSIANSVGKYEPERNRLSLTDAGNAIRFVNQWGDELRYCHPWKKWFRWDGKRWKEDDTGATMRRAKVTAKRIYNEASTMPDSDTQKEVAKHAFRSQNATRLREMLNLAQSELGIPVLPDMLDRDPLLFNVQNGTIDLRTGALGKYDPKDYITKLSPVGYYPDAECPLWQEFLSQIMDGDDDLIVFLQRAVGYSLTSSTAEQCFFILYGSGANGKSTFMNTVNHVVGDYGQQTPVDTLMVKRGNTIPNDLARLRGARLVSASEGEHGQYLAESMIKALTGNDKIVARFLHAEFFEFLATFKIFLATNHKPYIIGTDQAIWRRIRLVPFTVTIPDRDQDRELGEKLLSEVDGILAWAVRGCLDWQRYGMDIPHAVNDATYEYRSEMDILGNFIDDMCVVDRRCSVSKGDLYSEYQRWGGTESKNKFGRAMRERGFDPDKRMVNGAKGWGGIGLACDPYQEHFD